MNSFHETTIILITGNWIDNYCLISFQLLQTATYILQQKLEPNFVHIPAVRPGMAQKTHQPHSISRGNFYVDARPTYQVLSQSNFINLYLAHRGGCVRSGLGRCTSIKTCMTRTFASSTFHLRVVKSNSWAMSSRATWGWRSGAMLIVPSIVGKWPPASLFVLVTP